MARLLFPVLFLFLAAAPLGWAQRSVPALSEDRGTYLGVLFGPVPEARYAQSPALPRGQGVLVTHVLPNSPAVTAELQRDDILIQYDGEKIKDCEHLAQLISADRPQRKVKLRLYRGDREMTVEATLNLGPAMRLGAVNSVASKDAGTPRGTAKSNPPPAVSVSAAPQTDGTLKLTIEYYHEGAGRYRKVTCSGSADEIDRELQKLPLRVQELTRVALKRINALELNKTAPPGRSRQ